ncbi:protein kinase [Nannochloropsis gaditana CCMP526]|uniref:protein kinase n=1 Tax=Nannochloropsis gaditana (strain CCMP526) TaxID=1093141 RepID=UPI00029F71C2|nr:protein kinase [Nannochloropsis gaditana CCMP526]EKU20452.1 protein kinase [Nannochloropsis gaditana CCMP526]|eukprot:XP_005855908.1 protein kinase [Nannochloropsis gaditana CCMP526]
MGVPGLLSFLIQRLKHEEKRREALGEKEINDRASFHVSWPKESNLAGSLLFPPSLHSSLPSQVLPNVPVDSRVDVWAMGCLLYCLAYGRSPFESPTEGVLRLGILK